MLYLDEARLVVVDHPAGTMICPTRKLLAGKPFPPHELWTLRPLAPLKRAVRSDGLDVTEVLGADRRTDGFAGAIARTAVAGLAEPFSVTMDFGQLPVDRPLVLVLTGWLRFGGGMANVAASLYLNLPFPFPTLEVEWPDGSWKKVDVDVGAPAGKTKTILVDLDKKLPPGARRLRLTTAFEIYWDSACLARRLRRIRTIRPLWFPRTVIYTGVALANLPRCPPRCRSRRFTTCSGLDRPGGARLPAGARAMAPWTNWFKKATMRSC